MKAAGVVVGIAALGIVLALAVAMLAGSVAPAPDTGEILAGVGDIVDTLADGDVRFVQQVYVWSTWSNGVYLMQAMPYTVLAVLGAVLALGLGLVLMAFAVLGRQR